MRTLIFRKYRVQFLIKIPTILSLLMYVLCTSRKILNWGLRTDH